MQLRDRLSVRWQRRQVVILKRIKLIRLIATMVVKFDPDWVALPLGCHVLVRRTMLHRVAGTTFEWPPLRVPKVGLAHRVAHHPWSQVLRVHSGLARMGGA